MTTQLYLILRLRIYGAMPLLPSLLFNGYQGTSPRVKWPGCEVNHSSPSSVRVKNYWRYTSTPPLCLHGVERENVTFTFTFTFNFLRFMPLLQPISLYSKYSKTLTVFSHYTSLICLIKHTEVIQKNTFHTYHSSPRTPHNPGTMAQYSAGLSVLLHACNGTTVSAVD